MCGGQLGGREVSIGCPPPGVWRVAGRAGSACVGHAGPDTTATRTVSNFAIICVCH